MTLHLVPVASVVTYFKCFRLETKLTIIDWQLSSEKKLM